MGSLANVDPTYAQHVVGQIDAQLKELDANRKALQERRKQFAVFLPKKSTKSED